MTGTALLVAAVIGIRSAHQQQRLLADRARLAAILEATPDFVGIADARGQAIYVSRAGRRMLGLPEEGGLGTYPIGQDHPGWARRKVLEEGLPAAVRDGVWCGETALLSRAGREIPVLQVILAHRGQDGRVEYFSTIARDISDRKALEAHLADLANRDQLTGLWNRRRFQEEMDRQLHLARQEGARGALLFIDLDDFKAINDRLGHRYGDEVLRAVADRLVRHLQVTDLAARLGGDEFVAILPEADRDQAEVVISRLLAAFRLPLEVEGAQVQVGVSIGMALFPDHGLAVQELVARADHDMYDMKHTRQ